MIPAGFDEADSCSELRIIAQDELTASNRDKVNRAADELEMAQRCLAIVCAAALEDRQMLTAVREHNRELTKQLSGKESSFPSMHITTTLSGYNPYLGKV